MEDLEAYAKVQNILTLEAHILGLKWQLQLEETILEKAISNLDPKELAIYSHESSKRPK